MVSYDTGQLIGILSINANEPMSSEAFLNKLQIFINYCRDEDLDVFFQHDPDFGGMH